MANARWRDGSMERDGGFDSSRFRFSVPASRLDVGGSLQLDAARKLDSSILGPRPDSSKRGAAEPCPGGRQLTRYFTPETVQLGSHTDGTQLLKLRLISD